MTTNYNDLAERFCNLMSDLSTAYRLSNEPPPWNEMEYDAKRLATHAMEVVLSDRVAPGGRGQDLEFDRNRWQRMVGVLMTTVEQWAVKDGSAAAADLVDDLYHTVNTNHFTGAPETEPYLDVAKLTVEQTLRSAVAAGLVIPGPNAPASLGAPHQCTTPGAQTANDPIVSEPPELTPGSLWRRRSDQLLFRIRESERASLPGLRQLDHRYFWLVRVDDTGLPPPKPILRGTEELLAEFDAVPPKAVP